MMFEKVIWTNIVITLWTRHKRITMLSVVRALTLFSLSRRRQKEESPFSPMSHWGYFFCCSSVSFWHQTETVARNDSFYNNIIVDCFRSRVRNPTFQFGYYTLVIFKVTAIRSSLFIILFLRSDSSQSESLRTIWQGFGCISTILGTNH